MFDLDPDYDVDLRDFAAWEDCSMPVAVLINRSLPLAGRNVPSLALRVRIVRRRRAAAPPVAVWSDDTL